MNRTRIVFFAVAAVCVAILAYALAGQALPTPTLLRLYIASTVFAGGVVLLDFAGLLGHDSGTGGHDFSTSLDHAAGGAGHDFATLSGHDVATGHDVSGDLGAQGPGGHGPGGQEAGGYAHGDATPAGDSATAHGVAGAAGDGHAAGGQHAPASAQSNAAPILSVLVYLRLCVYFCLGFGPVGWVALASGRSALASLAFAVPAGVVAVFLARAFFRFQREDTGAVAPEAELVGERATVLIPLSDRVMGKVRVDAGMNVAELYARAADPGRAFERGDAVRIVRVTDECVQVR